MRVFWNGAAMALITAIVTIALPQAATAHFELNALARVIHLAPMDETPRDGRRLSDGQFASGGLRLLIRVPGPLAYARELAARATPQSPVVAPFIRSVPVRGTTYFALDRAAIGNVYSDGLRKSVAAASIVVASVWLVERIDLIASG